MIFSTGAAQQQTYSGKYPFGSTYVILCYLGQTPRSNTSAIGDETLLPHFSEKQELVYEILTCVMKNPFYKLLMLFTISSTLHGHLHETMSSKYDFYIPLLLRQWWWRRR